MEEHFLLLEYEQFMTIQPQFRKYSARRWTQHHKSSDWTWCKPLSMTSVRYSTMETHYRIFFFDRSNFLSIYLISGSYCRRAPCQNGGSCFEISSGYICVCTEGYSGSNCEMSECYLLYCFIMKYIPFVWNLPDMTNDIIYFQCTWLYFLVPSIEMLQHCH